MKYRTILLLINCETLSNHNSIIDLLTNSILFSNSPANRFFSSTAAKSSSMVHKLLKTALYYVGIKQQIRRPDIFSTAFYHSNVLHEFCLVLLRREIA